MSAVGLQTSLPLSIPIVSPAESETCLEYSLEPDLELRQFRCSVFDAYIGMQHAYVGLQV